LQNTSLAFALFRLTERNRDLLADYLNKTNLPNAKEMCSGQIDFTSVISDLENPRQDKKVDGASVGSIIKANTQTIPITRSRREVSVDLSQSYLLNLAMVKLMNHSLKQERAAVDNFRPS